MLQPDTGRIQAYRSPGGPGIRLDGALGAGNTVSRYYDSLLTKVGVHDSGLHGCTTLNLPLLIQLLA